MTGRLGAYALAISISAAVGFSGFGPFRCGIYGSCTGGYNWTPQMMLLGAAVGAVVGLVSAALIDLIYNGRYLLANRAEMKAKRKRDNANRLARSQDRDRAVDFPE